MAETVSRKIQFFRVNLQRVENNTLISIPNQSDGLMKIFNYIGILPFAKDEPTRYLNIEDGNSLAIYQEPAGQTIQGKIGFKRTNLLPDLEKDGQLLPLKLPDDSGLAEVTHFVYFPEDNILGIEFNFFGPRPTRLAEYIQKKSNGLVHRVEMVPILNLDVEEQLKRVGEVALLAIQVHKNALMIFKELNESLDSAFQAAGKASEAEVVEIVLRKKKYAREGFEFPFRRKKLLELLKSDKRQDLDKFILYAKDTITEENRKFDLLEDKLITAKKVVRTSEKRRTINSASMYSAIELAFIELQPQLKIRIG